MKIIEIKNLKKSYGNITAVKDISFSVEKGTLFAFLGCNGAGKSTTIDMLCTFLKPNQGQVYINGFMLGKENQNIRESIGIVFQDGLLDNLLTVEENLMTRASLYNLKGRALIETVNHTMKEMNIEKLAKRLYGTLSGGQKRRCDIARALIHNPQILFLDEPTTGLDPQTRQEVWQTILSLQKKNHITIFLTTHYMEEAVNADYIVILDEGKIVAQGTSSKLRKQYTKDKLKLMMKNKTLENQIKELGISYLINNNEMTIYLDNTFQGLKIVERFKEEIEDFEITRGSMDDAFIQITGKELY